MQMLLSHMFRNSAANCSDWRLTVSEYLARLGFEFAGDGADKSEKKPGKKVKKEQDKKSKKRFSDNTGFKALCSVASRYASTEMF